jgi:hypothetical protein
VPVNWVPIETVYYIEGVGVDETDWKWMEMRGSGRNELEMGGIAR